MRSIAQGRPSSAGSAQANSCPPRITPNFSIQLSRLILVTTAFCNSVPSYLICLIAQGSYVVRRLLYMH